MRGSGRAFRRAEVDFAPRSSFLSGPLAELANVVGVGSTPLRRIFSVDLLEGLDQDREERFKDVTQEASQGLTAFFVIDRSEVSFKDAGLNTNIAL